MVVTASLLDRLAAHRTLASVPRDQLAWLASAGVECTLEPGDILTSSGGPVRGLYVVFEGHLSIRVDRGAGPRIVMEWHGGDVTGVLPYSRIKSPPGNVVAEERTHLLELDTAELPRMIHECHELTAVLVHVMLDRARVFKSNELLDEKVLSLGRLAAGLAHELNNPASAVARSAKTLIRRARRRSRRRRKRFCALNLSDAAVRRRSRACATSTPGRAAALLAARARRSARTRSTTGSPRTGVDGARRRAAGRVRLSASRAGGARRARRDPTRWRRCSPTSRRGQTVRQLATEIDSGRHAHSFARRRRQGLHLHGSAGDAANPIAIGQGLADTVTVLRSKARDEVRRRSASRVPEHLPHGRGLRRRAQPGVGESRRQRHRRDARRTGAHRRPPMPSGKVVVRVDR